MHILASMLRQRQAAGDMNKQTKTYYGGASDFGSCLLKSERLGYTNKPVKESYTNG